MILEAFSKYLHEADAGISSTDVLARWLWETLSVPPQSNVDRVIHTEIVICRAEASEKKTTACELLIPNSETEKPNEFDVAYVFRGTSKSGSRLLNSLKEYCLSYEQQKWARWVHNLKASDFCPGGARSTDNENENLEKLD